MTGVQTCALPIFLKLKQKNIFSDYYEATKEEDIKKHFKVFNFVFFLNIFSLVGFEVS